MNVRALFGASALVAKQTPPVINDPVQPQLVAPSVVPTKLVGPGIPKCKNSKAKSALTYRRPQTNDEAPKPKPKVTNSSWQRFQERPDPPLKGQKPVPIGRVNCLSGKVFHITGVLDSLERDEAIELIQEYGGQVAKTLAKKVTHVIVGIQSSEVFRKKEIIVAERKLPVMNEDDLFDMIKTLPEPTILPSTKSAKKRAPVKTVASKPTSPNGSTSSTFAQPSADVVSTPFLSTRIESSQKDAVSEPSRIFNPPKPISSSTSELIHKDVVNERSKPSQQPIATHQVHSDDEGERVPTYSSPHSAFELLWADKWRPTSLKEISGNAPAILRLHQWLTKWKLGKVPLQKAALISGPPGIGKSTTAALLCDELGFRIVEYNASDTRSKSDLDSTVAKLVCQPRTINDFFEKSARYSNNPVADDAQSVDPRMRCIVMDEVDGMSSGDRGGLARLLQLIDETKVPIICICNDRSNPKMRSLKSRCEEIPFSRPSVTQVMARLLWVASQENLNVDQDVLALFYASSNNDLRHTLNLMQWNSLKPRNWTILKQLGNHGSESENIDRKDVDLGVFDAVTKMWNLSEDLSVKLDCYHVDSSMVPLLVQENYLEVRAYPRQDDLECFLRAADSISDGDLINQVMYEHSDWTLLDLCGMISSVAPCVYANRINPHRLNFPSWLAKYGGTQRRSRLLSELMTDVALQVTANRTDLRLDYASSLRRRMIRPLEVRGGEGIPQVVEFMDAYSMSRNDWDTVVELTSLSKGSEPNIETKVKTKFTRDLKKVRPLSRFAKGPQQPRKTASKDASTGISLQVGDTDENAEMEEEVDEDEESFSSSSKLKRKSPPGTKKTLRPTKPPVSSSSKKRAKTLNK